MNQGRINYIFKKSKTARRLRLAVYHDGRVVVTSPLGANLGVVIHFLKSKEDWIRRKIEYFKKKGPFVEKRKFSKKDYLENKGKASSLVKERLDFFNRHYRFVYKKVIIRNQKTRWGSCSRRGNLSFNFKIVFLSKEEQDYIIVHELCHLGEFNHSKNFWDLVSETIPEYLSIRKGLGRGIK